MGASISLNLTPGVHHYSIVHTPATYGSTIGTFLAINTTGSSNNYFKVDNITMCTGSGVVVSGAVAGYKPELKTSSDYYPFGQSMPGRQYNSGNYRYGFNGKENDNEVKGNGNQQDYGMRVYDPRLGKFLSVDPITDEYPELTPYQFASNRPIDGVDLDGLEFVKKTNGQVYYTEPKAGVRTEPTTAIGQPVLLEYNSVQNQTTMHAVNFKEIGKNSFKAIQTVHKIQGKMPSREINKGGAPIILKNGAKVELIDFTPTPNKVNEYGTLSVLNVKLKYSSKDKDPGSSYFLQVLPENRSGFPTEATLYDASEANNPFYFGAYLNKGKFEDGPGFAYNGKEVETFSASLYIYAKGGDVYKPVGRLDYSFQVKFDKNKKGTIINIKKSNFVDLSEK